MEWIDIRFMLSLVYGGVVEFNILGLGINYIDL